ncbi:MAG TPA: type II restriction endonuclease subunit M [Blastocatellia bacterium]|nr:type II restriction endonuclease subunit M [Blastocatellia bacterium]
MEPELLISSKDRKNRGIHYTPAALSRFVAHEIFAALTEEQRSRSLTILDPAVGDGSLLGALLEVLREAGLTPGSVTGFDTSHTALHATRERLCLAIPEDSLQLVCGDFLQTVTTNANDQRALSLEAPIEQSECDVVIANPPYVRTQVLGGDRAQELARQFALQGRVDLYFAFLIGIAGVLKPGGVAGLIVSNRFMTTRAGAGVREFLRRKFDVLHVVDLGDTRLFSAAVLPAVLILRKKANLRTDSVGLFTSIYSRSAPPAHVVSDVLDALKLTGIVDVESLGTFEVRHGTLSHPQSADAIWRLASNNTNDWLARVEAKTFKTFGELGQIRVGIKTTADRVFIRDDWDSLPVDEQPEVLRPVITHKLARRFKGLELTPSPKVLYTHETVRGKRVPIDLERYPRAGAYLAKHRTSLESRSYVTDAGRQWYEIWVAQDPEGWRDPKIVFRDISEAPTFWLDCTGAVVNGDCYWLSAHRDDLNLFYLALAIGNSSFIESFYDVRFNNKLYSGRRRFITQYVQDFPIPDPSSPESARLIELSKHIVQTLPFGGVDEAEAELDRLVWKAFGLDVEERPR